MDTNWKNIEEKKWPLLVRIAAGWMAAVCALLIFFCIPLDSRMLEITRQGPRAYLALMARQSEAVPDYQRFVSTFFYHASVLCAEELTAPNGGVLTPQATWQQKALSRQTLEELQQSEEYQSWDILIYLDIPDETLSSSALFTTPDAAPQGYEIVLRLTPGKQDGNPVMLSAYSKFEATQTCYPTKWNEGQVAVAVKQVPSGTNGAIWYAYQWINNSAIPTLACILTAIGVWGLLCLAVWVALWKKRRATVLWVASGLRRVPLFVKLVALGFAAFAGIFGLAVLFCALESYLYSYSVTFFASPFLVLFCLVVEPPLLWLLWIDVRFNLRQTLHGCLIARFVRWCKRLAAAQPWKRRVLLAVWPPILAGVALMAAAIPVAGFSWAVFWRLPWFFSPALGFSMLAVGCVCLATGAARLNLFLDQANDVADKIAALRAGDHTAPLALPPDALCAVPAADLNALEEGIQTRVEQQMRAERLKLELITNVSHDLKTPLTSIINYAGLLCEEPLEQPAADYAKILRMKAERLKTMVKDVFEVSKAASGELPLTMQPLDLAKLIRQTLADMDEAIEASPFTFVTRLPEQAWVCADGDRLYRVFQNLYTNALAYSLPGSRVYTQMECDEGQVLVSVKNVARDPIDPAAAQHLLERFVRGDSARSGEGSGLGLSIAKSFAEACGGSFSISAEADLFCARVSFPLCPPPTASEEGC